MSIEDIKKKGIVGAGGAGFPTHIKLSSRPEYIIMNAAECEPLIHKDMALLNHFMDEVLDGFRTAMTLTGASRGIIGIKSKHHHIIQLLQEKTNSQIQVQAIGDFYPAGDEITLIQQTVNRIPQPGSLPITVGCLVQNVETLYNIAAEKPVVDKFITVGGAVEEPLTVKVPVGTSYADLLSHFKITVSHYLPVSGGLMMGRLEKDLDQVVTKCTGGLVLLPSDHPCIAMYDRYSDPHNTVKIAKASCDQCSFCTELCPRYLLGYPVRPELAMRNRMFSHEENTLYHAGNAFCCECNLCTLYSCPEGLDPKGASVIEKMIIHQEKKEWQGLPVSLHPMMTYRKVPTKKLMQRLDILQYKDKGPLGDIKIQPSSVRIPLKQHTGSPAVPVVSEGQSVNRYDLIAEASGDVSANIHASIDGKIEKITQKDIVIQR